jgi:hypothetical protein
MNQTDRFALPLLETGQAQKEVTHNEAINAVDGLLHLAVESMTVTAPPAAPDAGKAWIVPAGSTGAWASMAGQIAIAETGGWRFQPPSTGMLAWVADAGAFARYDSGWTISDWPVRALRVGTRLIFAAAPVTVSPPAGGAVIDAEARTAIAALVAALRDQGVLA